jgi:putative adhesin
MMRDVILSTLLAVSFAAGALAQPADQRQGREPPPVPASPDASVDRLTIPLDDPNRPASIDVNVVMGSITVKGTARRDVLVGSRSTSVPGALRGRPQGEPPPPGLRRLTQNTPFRVDTDQNRIRIDVHSPSQSVDLTIEVPLRTNLELETVMGSISVEGVEGELEVESVNGMVTLTNVGGAVVAHTVNGKLVATITRVTPQQPMAFTSLNGSVDVTLPGTLKANLKLRSDQGDVYTDFDLQQLRQDASNPNPDTNIDVGRRGRRRVVINTSIDGSINGGGADLEMRTFNGNVYVRKGK